MPLLFTLATKEAMSKLVLKLKLNSIYNTPVHVLAFFGLGHLLVSLMFVTIHHEGAVKSAEQVLR